ncbi:MAG: squalene--hopene cyclase [Planctomycetaceae bacterium]|nr:squalene--hopene cyclase [Planctomycetaceae bacterium]
MRMFTVLMVAVALSIAMFVYVSSPVFAQDTQVRFGTDVPQDVQMIYERGLEWLASNQATDGTWDSSGGYGGPGINGMCVMAFLASGEDPNFGPYSENIRRAVRSMIRTQSDSTGFFGGGGHGSMYHHGFAMLGMSEVYGVLDEDSLWDRDSNPEGQRSIGQSLELAVRAAITSQKNNQWNAWRYSPEANDADTSVSGAVLMGLLAARNAGVKVPDEGIDKALEYFRSMTTNRGEVGYSGIGGGGSNNLKSIAALVFAIGKRKNLAEYKAVLERVSGNLEQDEYNYPEYYRYYTAQALFQGDFESWNKWNLKTARQLKDLQSEDGSFQSQMGPGYGTSMSLLAMALNYRFLPIYER